MKNAIVVLAVVILAGCSTLSDKDRQMVDDVVTISTAVDEVLVEINAD